MITTQYTKTTPLPTTIAEAMSEIAERLLGEQEYIASVKYNQRTGHLISSLNARPFTVTGGDNPQLTLDYPTTIRFLDLKKTAKGTTKRLRYPIYNRPLYGHIYGSGYSLTSIIRASLFRNIRVALTNITQTTVTISV